MQAESQNFLRLFAQTFGIVEGRMFGGGNVDLGLLGIGTFQFSALSLLMSPCRFSFKALLSFLLFACRPQAVSDCCEPAARGTLLHYVFIQYVNSQFCFVCDLGIIEARELDILGDAEAMMHPLVVISIAAALDLGPAAC